MGHPLAPPQLYEPALWQSRESFNYRARTAFGSARIHIEFLKLSSDNATLSCEMHASLLFGKGYSYRARTEFQAGLPERAGPGFKHLKEDGEPGPWSRTTSTHGDGLDVEMIDQDRRRESTRVLSRPGTEISNPLLHFVSLRSLLARYKKTGLRSTESLLIVSKKIYLVRQELTLLKGPGQGLESGPIKITLLAAPLDSQGSSRDFNPGKQTSFEVVWNSARGAPGEFGFRVPIVGKKICLMLEPHPSPLS